MSESFDSAQQGDQFEYETSLADLEPAAIRLLLLFPESNDDEQIYCTLSEHHFDSCPAYEALSYTWGNSRDRASIVCNGQFLSITSSLYRILLHLRGQEERALWIDQVSINQDDDREKSQQVGMMRDIYRRSERTVAWLGDPLASTEMGFETLHKLSEARIAISEILSNDAWLKVDDDPHGYNRLLAISRSPEKYWGIAKPNKMEMNAVLSVLRSPWFTRMWIVQEAAVSENLILQSGQYSISARYVILAFFVMQTMVAEQRTTVGLISRGGYEMLETLALCRYSYQMRDSTELSLLTLLCRCRQFQATDPRDRLFALYGLTSSSLLDLGLTPDYTIHSRDVLCSSYYKLMCDDQSLRLLELVESTGESDLPSWVPHQRVPSDPKLYPISDLYSIELASREMAISRVYQDIFADPSGFDEDVSYENPFDLVVANLHSRQKSEQERLRSLTPDLNIELLNDNTLCVQGQFLDRIAQVSTVVAQLGTMDQGDGKITRDFANYLDFEGLEEPDADAGALEVFKAMREGLGISMRYFKMQLSEAKLCLQTIADMDAMAMSRKQTAYYKSETAIFTAYQNTVSAGSLLPEHAKELNRYGWTGVQSNDAFKRWRANMNGVFQIDRMKKRLGLKSSTGNLGLLAASFRGLVSFDFESQKLSEAILPMYGRRLAWTARGHLALVPAQTAVNDHIFALRGSSMPCVLRSHENNWKILGPTYVDGMMKGELLDEDAVGTVKLV